MKINKITTIICSIASVITATALFIPCMHAVLQSVISNIFTGFFVSTIISTVGYCVEKAKLIKKAKSGTRLLFDNLHILNALLRKCIETLPDYEIINFSKIFVCANKISMYIEQMSAEDFHALFPNSEISCFFNDLNKRLRNLDRMKNDVAIISLNYAKRMEAVDAATSEKVQIGTLKLIKLQKQLEASIVAIEEFYVKLLIITNDKRNWEEEKESVMVGIKRSINLLL